MKRLVSVALVCLLVLSGFVGLLNFTSEQAEGELADTPWPCYGGDERRTGLSPYDTSHVNGTEKWNFNTGASVSSSPAIGSDGTVYVGSHDDNLYALTEGHDLTINIEGEGSTDPSEGTHTYSPGDEVTISATADEGWEFIEWQGTDETGEEITITMEEITITMDENKVITAVFQEDVVVETYELTLTIEGPGTVYYDLDEIDIVEDGESDTFLFNGSWGFILEEGTEVTLYIDEDDEENFENWDLPDALTDELDEDDLEIIFEMGDDKEITAQFKEEEKVDELSLLMIAVIVIAVAIIVVIVAVMIKKGSEEPDEDESTDYEKDGSDHGMYTSTKESWAENENTPKQKKEPSLAERKNDLYDALDSIKESSKYIRTKDIEMALQNNNLDRAEDLLEEQKKTLSTVEEIEEKIASLKDEEQMIDTRAIESALEDGETDEAQRLLDELKENYRKYKETIKELEKFDDRKSSLASQLADKEIDRDIYEDAVKNIEHKKAQLEEKLNKLRQEVIYEDYQKPF